ncbi:MAG: hypothetical protein JNM67_05320, partial [Bacteroidetes bacterium]|nr:hypothetical protein [Bacteroidota bacterium]
MTKPTPHYSPFGSLIPNRSWSDDSKVYRYGFNGKEIDFETANDNFPIAIWIGARIYDGRLGRWLSVDPQYSNENCIYLSPYCYSASSPIFLVDRNGELWWVAVGGVIGAVGTALKLAIKGEFHWDDKRTWAKVGLGFATGAAIALCPAGALGAGGTLLSSQLIASSILAGSISSTSNLIDQGIDKYFAGEDPFNLRSYNYGLAAFNGFVSSITFGAAATFGNQAALQSSEFLWRSFHDNVALYGVLANSFLDVSRAAIEGIVEEYPDLFSLNKSKKEISEKTVSESESDMPVITFPPIRIKFNRNTGET